MECKGALSESNGDVEKAFKILREKGIAKAEKKSGRDAKEGLIGIKINDSGAAIIEVNSETDFVSRNNEFHNLLNEILNFAIEEKGNFNSVANKSKELINNAVSKIGENIVFKRSDYLEGSVYSYMHNSLTEGLGKIGVILLIVSQEKIDLADIGKNLCMHIAASSPKSVSIDDLDKKFIESEKEIISNQLKDSGKPENILTKMIEGKIKKYLEEVVLLNQKFVIDPNINVEKYLENESVDKGTKITIEKFIRFEIGQ